MNLTDRLFDEFPPVSAEEWKQKILEDLKGEPYETLLTPTLEGITIQPFYHRETARMLDDDYEPGPFVLMREYRFWPGKEEINEAFERDTEKIRIQTAEALPSDAPRPEDLEIEWTNFSPEEAGKASERGISQVLSPFRSVLARGRWPLENRERTFEAVDRYLQIPGTYLEIDTSLWQNAGAHTVQQIALALHEARFWALKYGEEILPRLRFKWATGYHYFFEIAKYRAFRYLWEEMTGIARPEIYAVPSIRNMTLFDPYVNMLRTGMEMMAAVLGGATRIANYPYNYIYKKFDSKAMRLAANQLLILREEAKFESVRNAFKRAYYPSTIAALMAEKALDLLRRHEEEGDFLQAILSGKWQAEVRETARREQELFDSGKLVLTGTNKYVNENETPPETDRNPFSEFPADADMEPVVPVRLAEKTEKERLAKLSKP
ncbi:MAG: hypothetical protein GXO27_00705 [Chlorobi bacterium]|nr:hypothetical protein [Chlorobiota bacterium]